MSRVGHINSILYPSGVDDHEYHRISDTSWHDLGMDLIVQNISKDYQEQTILKNVMVNLSKNPMVARYRSDVFEDIISQAKLRENIMELLMQVDKLQEFMDKKMGITESDGIWTLTRRLKEVREYILCIEKLGACLSEADIHSQALLELREYVLNIQENRSFAELKKDIDSIHMDTQKVKSITLGVNLGEYYDAVSVGIVSLNDKAFSKAGLLSNFTRKLQKGDRVQEGNEWNNNYTYEEISENSRKTIHSKDGAYYGLATVANPLMGLSMRGLATQSSGMAGIAPNSKEVNLIEYLNEVANSLLASSIKRLKEVLSKYATVDIRAIVSLIPEFQYYILWAEYIEKMEKEGYEFHKAEIMESTDSKGQRMKANNIYNLKLAALSEAKAEEIVGNDLVFDDSKCIYILTGANRGGKTTITQAIGQLYLMAQGGIYIPGNHFLYQPVDDIFTHFPADEDKTMDYGRLGEECKRFRQIFKASSHDSLILLNETFSTTSFEEGYFIARDAIRAMLQKGARTIYNTHMHKLAMDVTQMNEGSEVYKAASLIVKTQQGQRSYKVEVAAAEGVSFAQDIAEKYGVTYQQLMEE